MKTLFFPMTAAVLILTASGCLPAGTPPEGRIVVNPLPGEPVTAAKAKELAIVGFGAWSLAHAPGEPLRIRGSSDDLGAEAAEVVREAGLLSGVYASPAGKKLFSVEKKKGGRLTYSLLDAGGKVLWRAEYQLEKPKR